MECLRKATPGAGIIQVIDTRPMVNAKVNMAGGKGHESDKFYENMKFSFKGIENIHKMRKSLEHLTFNIVANTSLTMDVYMTGQQHSLRSKFGSCISSPIQDLKALGFSFFFKIKYILKFLLDQLGS